MKLRTWMLADPIEAMLVIALILIIAIIYTYVKALGFFRNSRNNQAQNPMLPYNPMMPPSVSPLSGIEEQTMKVTMDLAKLYCIIALIVVLLILLG